MVLTPFFFGSLLMNQFMSLQINLISQNKNSKLVNFWSKKPNLADLRTFKKFYYKIVTLDWLINYLLITVN